MPTFVDWKSAIRAKMKDNETILISESDKSGAGDASTPVMPDTQDTPSTSCLPKSEPKPGLKKERILTDADWISSLGEQELKWIKKHVK